ncbi:MAG: hypothetical protein EOP04_18930 [Proteobacteria bacterium]|nr:MAG: hypothetical protein EOP04_18930 [Pseudomonadota bacterium]
MRFILALQLVLTLGLTLTTSGCAGGGGGGGTSGNDSGSSPINAAEEKEYKRAINKCYKTGGSRVVKVEGQLMCY